MAVAVFRVCCIFTTVVSLFVFHDTAANIASFHPLNNTVRGFPGLFGQQGIQSSLKPVVEILQLLYLLGLLGRSRDIIKEYCVSMAPEAKSKVHDRGDKVNPGIELRLNLA
jgi:hypothetical protein